MPPDPSMRYRAFAAWVAAYQRHARDHGPAGAVAMADLAACEAVHGDPYHLTCKTARRTD